MNGSKGSKEEELCLMLYLLAKEHEHLTTRLMILLLIRTQLISSLGNRTASKTMKLGSCHSHLLTELGNLQALFLEKNGSSLLFLCVKII